MIKIEKPQIVLLSDNQQVNIGVRERGGRLVSHVVNEGLNEEYNLWFETTEEYSKYLCDDVCDAFVVAMLIPAVQTQQDIQCECISEKLLYNINRLVTCMLQIAWGGRRIEVVSNSVKSVQYGASAVGAGCSLGIDSFAAILSHSKDTTTPNYQLTHLTNFNVGAFGSTDLEMATKSWHEDLIKIRSFTDEYGLPLLTIDSNIGITSKGISFDKVFHFRNIAAALSIQKLFGKYIIGSGRKLNQFRFDRNFLGYYETLLVPMLSTENTEFILSEGDKTRVEKTYSIMNNEYVKKHLYVCWKEIFKNEWPDEWELIKESAEKNRNCTTCNKCMRTCITLDLYGCLDEYKDCFDLPQYYKTRDKYIKKILALKKGDSFCADIYDLMIEKHYPIPMSAKVGAYWIRAKAVISGLIRKIVHH